MSNNIIRSVGTIVKKEKLASIENATSSKTLILESLLPYPGYHGTTIPDKLEPESLFAVTKLIYQDEQIIRTIQKVKESCKITFDAVPGTIFLKNNPVNIIRFKGIGYNMISEIIKHFTDAGINFEKVRKIAPYGSIIRIRKFFNMNMLSEGIYEDMDVKEFFYVQVSKYPDWDTFEEITRNIKYNIEDLVFDGAQTSVYDAQGLVDFVRIYDRNRYTDKLSYIRKCYQDAYNKL
jgi:hypothetical protein